jgi:hypothetical protein
MTSRHLTNTLLLAALALPGPALGRSWQGVTPGVTTQAEVIARFGEPSTKGKLEGRVALVYKGDQAISGTRQAQFLVGDGGVVSEINVFPATQLDKDSVAGTYGKEPQKTFTDDFRPVWIYRPIGVMVFFGKEGLVEAIRFKAPEHGATEAPPPAGTPPPAKTPPPRAAATRPAPGE